MYLFSVEMRPVPQGSMTASYNRVTGISHVHHVQGSALALWRAAIREEARKAGVQKSYAPIIVTIDFGMTRPKAHMQLRGGKYVPKQKYADAIPALMPDIDKLARAVLDALTGVAYNDDAQVVGLHCTKVYADHTNIRITDYAAENSLW